MTGHSTGAVHRPERDLRPVRLTTVFGNPGPAEQPFLQEFPDDFSCIPALQEASVIAMADAFAQVTRRPAPVSGLLLDLVAEGEGRTAPEPMARPRLLPGCRTPRLLRPRSTPC